MTKLFSFFSLFCFLPFSSRSLARSLALFWDFLFVVVTQSRAGPKGTKKAKKRSNGRVMLG